MSIEGLCRTLLYDILSQLKDETAIKKLFPERLEVLDLFGYDQEQWTATECLRSLQQLSQSCFNTYRIFFLIDGLDEFSGDQQRLLTVLHSLGQSPHMKICCASRPWVEFQDAFHQAPSLMLQNLTRPDIEKYVEIKFDTHPAMKEAHAYSPETTKIIFQEICDKSSGVFLWVVLVVKSLLNGISSGDRISDLQVRLKEIPEDLDALFDKMIGSMIARYKSHASQIFQTHKMGEGQMDLIFLSFADDFDKARIPSSQSVPFWQGEYESRCKVMSRRLESRTKGLLEGYKHSEVYSDLSPCIVQYLHRTVRDYLNKPAIWNRIVAMTHSDFDPRLSHAIGYLSLLKTKSPRKTAQLFGLKEFKGFLTQAALCRPTSQGALGPLLDDLNKYLGCLPLDNQASFDSIIRRVHSRLLPMAVALNMSFWVEDALKREVEKGFSTDYWAYMEAALDISIHGAIFGDNKDLLGFPFPGQTFRILLQLARQQGGRSVENQGKVDAVLDQAIALMHHTLPPATIPIGIDYVIDLNEAFAEVGMRLLSDAEINVYCKHNPNKIERIRGLLRTYRNRKRPGPSIHNEAARGPRGETLSKRRKA
jgi:hypothetical protein